MTITEFLEARLAEDEEVAYSAAFPGSWQRDGINSVEGSSGQLVIYGDGPAPSSSQADHIARHDPARALAEVEAKRAILAEYTKEQWVIEQGHRTEWTMAGQSARETTLRHLAAVYSDHPDYAAKDWRVA